MTKESKPYIEGRLASEEVLIITQEECAEVSQAISKILRFGLNDQYDGKTNKERLEQEIGDLMCMIDILYEKNIISQNMVDASSVYKRDKLKQWSNIL
jgi:NTP pyrophosphatase (non-canonical NTP hydrolase)